MNLAAIIRTSSENQKLICHVFNDIECNISKKGLDETVASEPEGAAALPEVNEGGRCPPKI